MKRISEVGGDFTPVRFERCEKHGEYMSVCYLGRVWSKCKKCSAENVVREAEVAKAEDERRRKSEFDKRVKSMLEGAGFPQRFVSKGFGRFRVENDGQAKALRFSRAYAASVIDGSNGGKCVLFTGGIGTGKTHLAVSVGMECVKAGKSVVFTTIYDALSSVKATWGGNGSEAKVIRLLAEADLLILDEIGVQHKSDSDMTIIASIMNKRYADGKPTLMISNLTSEEIVDVIGERVVDRMKEDGGSKVVFDWSSQRGKR